MIDRLISFADPEGEAYGAIGLAGDRAAGGYVLGPGGALKIADGRASRGEGSLRVEAGDGELILGLAAQTSPLGFETGEGRRVTVQAVGASGECRGSGFEATGVAWTIEGEDDQGSLRTLWAALGDGSLLVLFELGAQGAADHGSEPSAAARTSRDGGVDSYTEPLLSTEYDAAVSHTRATLELWAADPEEGALAERGAKAATSTLGVAWMPRCWSRRISCLRARCRRTPIALSLTPKTSAVARWDRPVK